MVQLGMHQGHSQVRECRCPIHRCVSVAVLQKDIQHFHKFKLHTILFDDELHPAVRRQHAKELSDEK
eukprot:158111-Pleurochrysis_carterae.AAC.1